MRVNRTEKTLGAGLFVGGLIALGITLEMYSNLGDKAWLIVLSSALICLAGAGMFKKSNLY